MGRTSNKREEIFQFLKEFIAENGYPPSTREIMDGVGLQSTASVHYHLTDLRKEGRITMAGSKNRAISINEPRGTPVLGVVTAGQPILAVENIEGYLPWIDEPECFALRVRGDSMIEAGIFDGDAVVVRPQPTAENGEIVVALLGEEATVKRFKRAGRQVWLMPENPAYSPIDARTAQIIGKVRAVIRQF